MVAGSLVPDEVVARAKMDRLERRLIRRLRQMEPGRRAEQGARNLWDEFCMEVQKDSELLPICLEEIGAQLDLILLTLPTADKFMLWFVTLDSESPGSMLEGLSADKVMARYSDWKIAQHMMSRIQDAAMNYENRRIRLFVWG